MAFFLRVFQFVVSCSRGNRCFRNHSIFCRHFFGLDTFPAKISQRESYITVQRRRQFFRCTKVRNHLLRCCLSREGTIVIPYTTNLTEGKKLILQYRYHSIPFVVVVSSIITLSVLRDNRNGPTTSVSTQELQTSHSRHLCNFGLWNIPA